MSGHRIEWRIDRDGTIGGRAVCDEPEGSDCRLTCAEGCEQWGAIVHAPEGDFHLDAWGEDADLRHPLESTAGYCNVITFLNGDGCPEELYDGPDDAQIHDGPIGVRWDGDTYLWHYAEVES